MKDRSLLVRLVDASRRHAVPVVLLAIVLAGLSFVVAGRRLGVSTDTDKLFRSSLPWRQRQIAFERGFPQERNVLVAVVNARIPEEADATAAGLAAALRADPAHFVSVTQPDVSPYFSRNGLLFLNADALGHLLDSTVDAQPFLGQLAADPSARGLFAALSLVAVGVQRGQADLTPYLPALQGFHATLAAAASGHPVMLSWQQLLAGFAGGAGGGDIALCWCSAACWIMAALQPGGVATQRCCGPMRRRGWNSCNRVMHMCG